MLSETSDDPADGGALLDSPFSSIFNLEISPSMLVLRSPASLDSEDVVGLLSIVFLAIINFGLNEDASWLL